MSSRAIMLSRVLVNGLKAKLPTKQIVRNSGHHTFYYRTGPKDHPKIVKYGAEAVGAFMWWWILWHMWYESGHVFGEWDYPDVSQWTDKELGIPPDSADDE